MQPIRPRHGHTDLNRSGLFNLLPEQFCKRFVTFFSGHQRSRAAGFKNELAQEGRDVHRAAFSAHLKSRRKVEGPHLRLAETLHPMGFAGGYPKRPAARQNPEALTRLRLERAFNREDQLGPDACRPMNLFRAMVIERPEADQHPIFGSLARIRHLLSL